MKKSILTVGLCLLCLTAIVIGGCMLVWAAQDEKTVLLDNGITEFNIGSSNNDNLFEYVGDGGSQADVRHIGNAEYATLRVKGTVGENDVYMRAFLDGKGIQVSVSTDNQRFTPLMNETIESTAAQGADFKVEQGIDTDGNEIQKTYYYYYFNLSKFFLQSDIIYIRFDCYQDIGDYWVKNVAFMKNASINVNQMLTVIDVQDDSQVFDLNGCAVDSGKRFSDQSGFFLYGFTIPAEYDYAYISLNLNGDQRLVSLWQEGAADFTKKILIGAGNELLKGDKDNGDVYFIDLFGERQNQTKQYFLLFQDPVPTDGNGVQLQNMQIHCGKNEPYPAGTTFEPLKGKDLTEDSPFVVEYGGGIGGGESDAYRFFDYSDHAVYRFQYGETVDKLTLRYRIGAEYLLEVSKDNSSWTQVAVNAFKDLLGADGRHWFSSDISFLQEGNAERNVYVRISDSVPMTGNGGQLEYVAVAETNEEKSLSFGYEDIYMVNIAEGSDLYENTDWSINAEGARYADLDNYFTYRMNFGDSAAGFLKMKVEGANRRVCVSADNSSWIDIDLPGKTLCVTESGYKTYDLSDILAEGTGEVYVRFGANNTLDGFGATLSELQFLKQKNDDRALIDMTGKKEFEELEIDVMNDAFLYSNTGSSIDRGGVLPVRFADNNNEFTYRVQFPKNIEDAFIKVRIAGPNREILVAPDFELPIENWTPVMQGEGSNYNGMQIGEYYYLDISAGLSDSKLVFVRFGAYDKSKGNGAAVSILSFASGNIREGIIEPNIQCIRSTEGSKITYTIEAICSPFVVPKFTMNGETFVSGSSIELELISQKEYSFVLDTGDFGKTSKKIIVVNNIPEHHYSLGTYTQVVDMSGNILETLDYAPEKYTLTLKLGNEDKTMDVNYNTLLSSLDIPERDGRVFSGWYQDEACTKQYDEDTLVKGDMTLYAKWENAREGCGSSVEATSFASVVGPLMLCAFICVVRKRIK